MRVANNGTRDKGDSHMFTKTWLIDTLERAAFSFAEAFVAALVLTDLSSVKVALVAGGTALLATLKAALAARRSGTISPASVLRAGRHDDAGITRGSQARAHDARVRTSSGALRRSRAVAASALVGVLGAGGLALATAPAASAQVVQGASCSSRSAMVLQWGFTAVSANGSARGCSTNNPNNRICMTVALTRYGTTVARSGGCRYGAGSLSVSTPIVNRNAPMSAYQAVQTVYAP